jgi:hypothetical protein
MNKLVLGCLLLVPTAAAAQDNGPVAGPAPTGTLVLDTRPDGVILARSIHATTTPATPDGPVALAASRYIYLNKNGAVLSPGNDDSGDNVSSIVPNTRNFPAWQVSAGDWNAVRSAVQELFAPFDVVVSDQPPPSGTRFVMAMFGGGAGDALPADQVPDPSQGYILGVSPFTIDCGVIEDSIVFTFAEDAKALGISNREIAEIAAQEIAHSFGLDHVMNASDPMTYLNYNGNRSFKPGTVSCGENQNRPCGLVNQGYPSCRPNQDSVALLNARIGIGGGTPGDTIPPTVSITAPGDNDLVPPGFAVYASAQDNIDVTSVELYIDGVLVDTATTSPYNLTAPGDIGTGDHEVLVVASDGAQSSEDSVRVTVDEGADPVDPGGNGGDGDGDGNTGGAVVGACSAGGSNAGLVLGLALVGLALSRRRRG